MPTMHIFLGKKAISNLLKFKFYDNFNVYIFKLCNKFVAIYNLCLTNQPIT